MRVALLGGSGYLGGLIMPYLKDSFELSVLDRAPPLGPYHYQPADADERPDLAGFEALIYMGMSRHSSGEYDVSSMDGVYDIHVKNLHRWLDAACQQGVKRALYASSLSVFATARPGDETPCDATDLYGFCKHLGEQVCAHISRVQGLTTVALRLGNPLSDEAWQEHVRLGAFHGQTAALDVARAFSLALTRPLSGFQAINIAGDWRSPSSRAQQLLGWEPVTRPHG